MKTKLPIFATLFTILAFLTLVSLGSWQVKRLLWKNNLIAEITERAGLPPIFLPDSPIDIENMQYRKIKLEGHFLNDKEVHLFTGANRMKGDPGYNIITPLEMADGRVVLVDRGWVPAKKKEQEKRQETIINRGVSLVGMLHKGEHKGLFTPDNDIAKNLWFWLDIPAISGFTGKTLDNVYVRALAEDGEVDDLPIAGKAEVQFRNDHLQYAITWYSLAIILLVIYLVYIRGLALKERQ